MRQRKCILTQRVHIYDVDLDYRLPNMWAPAIIAIFAGLAGECYAGLKSESVPVTIVPITNSGKTADQPLHDAFLTVDVDVGTPGTLQTNYRAGSREGHLNCTK